MYWNCDSNKLNHLQVRSIIWFLFLFALLSCFHFIFYFIFIKLCLYLEWLEGKDLHVVIRLYIHFLSWTCICSLSFFPNWSIFFSFHVVYLFYFDLIPLRIECSRGLDSQKHDLLLIWFLMLCQIMRFRKVLFGLF